MHGDGVAVMDNMLSMEWPRKCREQQPVRKWRGAKRWCHCTHGVRHSPINKCHNEMNGINFSKINVANHHVCLCLCAPDNAKWPNAHAFIAYLSTRTFAKRKRVPELIYLWVLLCASNKKQEKCAKVTHDCLAAIHTHIFRSEILKLWWCFWFSAEIMNLLADLFLLIWKPNFFDFFALANMQTLFAAKCTP